MINSSEQLHETVVKDIFDIVSDIKDFDQIEWLQNKNNTGSIARRASKLVLVFPVIVPNTISIETGVIITKAIERKCCTLLQILFSSMQITSADNLIDYLKQFHTNLDLKNNMDLDEFFELMDRLVDEGSVIVDKDMYDSIKEDMHNINFHLENNFNEQSINDYKISNNMYGEPIVALETNYHFEKGYNNYDGAYDNDSSSSSRKKEQNRRTMMYQKYDADDIMNAMQKSIDQKWNKEGNKFVNKAVDKQLTKAFKKGINVNNNIINNGGRSNYDASMKDYTDYFQKQLMDNEVKKANELMPTTMIVNFISSPDNTDIPKRVSGVIGVKAKMYPVDSMDIVNRLTSKIKDRNGLFNLVRASTREISFFKDLAFAIDKAKMDAVYMASDSNNARMFKVLERRAAKNKFSRLIKKNNASPITSLVLSQYEVDYMKQLNLDMEKSYNARTILEAYNLMDIVIADESLEIAKFLFDDGDGVYEVLTFDALEKQANDNTYKKVVNLVSKINR